MGKQLNMTVELTPDEVMEAITLYLTEQLNNEITGSKLFDINFKHSNRVNGRDPDQDCIQFEGASIKVTIR